MPLKLQKNNSPRTLPYLTLGLIFILLLPAMLLRDLNPVNELNYLAIAADALERGAVFAFYQDGAPYADKPPAYLWLCMLSYKLTGTAGGLLLLFSVLPFIGLLALSRRFAAADVGPRPQAQLMLALCAVLFMTGLSLVARMDMLFALLIAVSYVLIIERSTLVLNAVCGSAVTFGNKFIPLTIFAALFVKGPYALIFPLVGLLFYLLALHQVKAYFKIFRPHYFLIILACVLLWALGVYLDGGKAYLTELFVGQSAKRLSGSAGHPEPIYWYLTNIWYLAAPLTLPAIYLVIRDVKQRTLKQDHIGLASLCFFLAVFAVISLPSSKLEIYLLPGLPFLALYVLRALKRCELQGQVSRMLKLCLGINFLPFALIFPALFFFTGRYPFLQHPMVYAGAFCLSVGSCWALRLIWRSVLTKALAAEGLTILVFIGCVGLALPTLNSYLGVQEMAEAASRDLGAGPELAICTQGIAKAENLPLYDRRFTVFKNANLHSAQCQNAALFVGRSALRSHPELIAQLKARGGYYIGDNIYVPAPQAQAE